MQPARIAVQTMRRWVEMRYRRTIGEGGNGGATPLSPAVTTQSGARWKGARFNTNLLGKRASTMAAAQCWIRTPLDQGIRSVFMLSNGQAKNQADCCARTINRTEANLHEDIHLYTETQANPLEPMPGYTYTHIHRRKHWYRQTHDVL